MGLRYAVLGILGLTLLAPRAEAGTNGSALDCPNTGRAGVQTVDADLRSLDARLEHLQASLALHQAVRDKAIAGVREQTETAIQQARLSPDKIDAIVARAIARAKTGALRAAKAERAVEAIRPQVEALQKRLATEPGERRDDLSEDPDEVDAPAS